MDKKAPVLKNQRQSTGKLGEDLAAAYLVRNGFTIVEHNCHIAHKEIDLIAKNDTHIVFAEVKTRHATYGVRSPYGRPARSVTMQKRLRIVEATKAYLRENPSDLQPRFDVIEVYLTRRRNPDGTTSEIVNHIEHIPRAFGAYG